MNNFKIEELCELAGVPCEEETSGKLGIDGLEESSVSVEEAQKYVKVIKVTEPGHVGLAEAGYMAMLIEARMALELANGSLARSGTQLDQIHKYQKKNGERIDPVELKIADKVIDLENEAHALLQKVSNLVPGRRV